MPKHLTMAERDLIAQSQPEYAYQKEIAAE